MSGRRSTGCSCCTCSKVTHRVSFVPRACAPRSRSPSPRCERSPAPSDVACRRWEAMVRVDAAWLAVERGLKRSWFDADAFADLQAIEASGNAAFAWLLAEMGAQAGFCPKPRSCGRPLRERSRRGLAQRPGRGHSRRQLQRLPARSAVDDVGRREGTFGLCD